VTSLPEGGVSFKISPAFNTALRSGASTDAAARSGRLLQRTSRARLCAIAVGVPAARRTGRAAPAAIVTAPRRPLARAAG
jgi:hypothetical protein